ncbi:MAG: Uma2 family endonuclease [Acidobacteria bacterium]|nr:Uma2 family endonuclease [Acidobacteriota bacterium]
MAIDLTTQIPNPEKPGLTSIPRLENGDHLTRAEFERRYLAMPEKVKAELIEGRVYMASPVRIAHHAKPHSRIMTWLGNYVAFTEIADFADNSTVRLDHDNEPQPDAVLFVKEGFGGNSFVSDDDYLEGSPELVVEIASSSASYDTNEKKRVYQRNGVKEYIIWRVDDKEIDWFVWDEGEFVKLEPNADSIVESRFFGGLRLNVRAMLNDDLKAVLSELAAGLNSGEHDGFEKRFTLKN